MTCEGCSTAISPGSHGRRYCSDRCRERIRARRRSRPKVCGQCGAEFSARHHGRTDRAICAWCRYATNASLSCPVLYAQCAWCSAPFVKRFRQRLCSDDCRRLWINAQQSAAYHDPSRPARDIANRARHSRRARLAGCQIERYEASDIFERDGWRCHLCTRRIDRAARWPAPESASLDHIVPISAGGADAEWNVAAAHLHCNLSRGTRGVVQLRLIA